MASVRKHATITASTGLLLASFAFLYRDIVVKLVRDWVIDDNYSHGFLILPLAIYFAWERRNRLAQAVQVPSNLGLIVVAGSLIVFFVGILGSELFLTRISLFGSLTGAILFLYGWQYLRVLAFPLAFLFLMIPIPRIVFDPVVFPLQLMASRLAEITLSTLGVPVLREGNLIVLAHSTLEVAEACSGIRSLVSLLTLAIIYGYFTDPRKSVRAALAIGTVPVAIIANGLRVAGTGLAAQYYGGKAAEAFFDTFSGWILFTVAFSLLFGLYRLVIWIAPLKRQPSLRRALERGNKECCSKYYLSSGNDHYHLVNRGDNFHRRGRNNRSRRNKGTTFQDGASGREVTRTARREKSTARFLPRSELMNT